MNRKLDSKSFSVFSVFIILAVVFFATPLSQAQAQEKLATVSLQRALNEVEEGKKAKDALKADFDAKQKQIESMKTDLKKMKEDLDKQKSVWSADVVKQKTDELQSKFMDLQQKAGDYESELKKKESDSADKILAALKTMVIDLAKKDGYTLLFENSAEFILYSTKGVDITDELIKAYNASGGSAAVPAKKK